MKINLPSFTRASLFAVMFSITQCVYGQLDLGYGPGMFPVDLAVDEDENHYLLTFYNSVQVFNKDREFVRKFSIADGPVYPSLKSIEVDVDKQLHIVDDANDVIHIYSPEGTFIRQVLLEAGSYQDIAMDAAGNYYLVERGANVVRILDKDGVEVREFGSGVFGSVFSVHVAANGNIFTCDYGTYPGKPAAVRVFDNAGNYIANVGSSGGTHGTYSNPTAVQTDAAGYVYVYFSTNVIKYYPTFSFLQQYDLRDATQGVSYAGYAFCLTKDKLFFADSRHRIQVFDTSLDYQHTIAGFSADEGKFDGPEGIAVDEDNNIYVADTRNYRVQVFDAQGNFKTAFGSYGPAADQFFNMSDLAVDSKAGIVYVLDSDISTNQTVVKKFSQAGVFIEEFEIGNTSISRFALDEAGSIYVNDRSNDQIKVFSSAGALLRTIPLGDSPEGITIGTDNRIYVTVYVQANRTQIRIFSRDGALINQFDLPRENRPSLYGIAVLEDYIFVSDKGGVRKFHKNGTFIAELEVPKGDAPGSFNTVLENGGVFRPDLAIWKGNLLLSDALRVQSVAVKQTITFPEIAPKRFGDEPFGPVASSSSGFPVTVTVSDPSVASVSDEGMVTIHKPGTVSLTATQDGGGFLDPAEPVSRDLVIRKGAQIITFKPIGERILGEAPVVLEAESSTGLPVSFTVDDPSVASIEGNVMTLLQKGTANIKAVQEGDAFYESAEASQVLVVNLITGMEHDFNATDVYPNPTHDRINVLLIDEVVKESMVVMDNMGKPIPVPPGSIIEGDDRLEVDLGHLNAGIYYLHITTRRQGVRVHKVIKL